jgi:hypothetical protein
VTKARDQNNKHDKLALATYGKKVIAQCFESNIHAMQLFFGLACFVVGSRLRNTDLPVLFLLKIR